MCLAFTLALFDLVSGYYLNKSDSAMRHKPIEEPANTTDEKPVSHLCGPSESGGVSSSICEPPRFEEWRGVTNRRALFTASSRLTQHRR